MNRIRGVSIDFIDSLNESAKSTYPDEFICLHREHDGVIDELVMLPGTIFGDSHSVIFDWMDPVDFHRSGSAHSPGIPTRPPMTTRTSSGVWAGSISSPASPMTGTAGGHTTPQGNRSIWIYSMRTAPWRMSDHSHDFIMSVAWSSIDTR